MEDNTLKMCLSSKKADGNSDTERLTPSFIITAEQRSAVQSGSEAVLPWQLCAAAVTMAAACLVLQFLLAQHVSVEIQCRLYSVPWGLQTLGLIQVPATHLGLAGQEL